MADPYWDPIFARLQDDLDLLRLMAADLGDDVLLGCLGPNPPLQKRLAPYVKGRRVTKRGPFLDGLLGAAGRDEALRRILFFSWITGNPATMKFPTIPADEAALARLRAGEFGPPAKIAILARIDPRPAAAPLLARFLAECSPLPGSSDSATASGGSDPGAPRPDSPGAGGLTEGAGPRPPDAAPGAQARLADLERRLREALDESRALRRHLKEVEGERNTLQQRASQQGGALAAAQEDLRKARAANSRLELEVGRLSAELARRQDEEKMRAARTDPGDPTSQAGAVWPGGAPAAGGAEVSAVAGAGLADAGPAVPAVSAEGRAPAAADLASLRQRVVTLEEALARRAATIERLERDLAGMRDRVDRAADQEDQVARLQHLLGEREAELLVWRGAMPGRVVARAREGGRGGFVCLVEVAGGDLVRVPERCFRPGPPLEGEWVLVRPGMGTSREVVRGLRAPGSESPEPACFGAASGEQVASEGSGEAWGWALEAAYRVERVGILTRHDGEWFLEGENESWPIGLAVDPADEGRPAAGLWLPGFGERRAGVWALRFLATRSGTTPQTFASFRAIERFWRLLPVDPARLVQFLAEAGVACTPGADGIRFDRDYRVVLGGWRGRLPVTVVCERPACREVGRGKPGFLRRAEPEEACALCGETASGSDLPTPVTSDFGGARVVIVGGDVVGCRYAEALAPHHLKVDWHSGFAGLGALREGLGGAAAVVIILKQVSHTVLRELLPVAQAAGVPVLFCPVRGVSGVLRLLSDFLRPAPR